MPLPVQYNLPKTTDDKEFECMVRDCFEIQYGNAELYGRNGQRQNGIDIICHVDDHDKGNYIIGIQCKNYQRITKDNIDDIITEAEKFEFPLGKFVIATSASRDVKIQDYVFGKNLKGSDVEIYFWEDISEIIAYNPELLKKYYPLIGEEDEMTIEKLVKLFNEGVQVFNILQFIRMSPLNGIYSDYALEANIFCNEIEKILDQAILLQNDEKYKEIKSLCNWVGWYNQELEKNFSPAGTGYYVPTDSSKVMRIQEIEKIFKGNVNECYSKINPNCKIIE
ncbi:MAG: hypothetical protein MSA72_19115 [Lachnospiraceae bacterium]|nr:hypothetical protein [Lachnospiraceae bacterium]